MYVLFHPYIFVKLKIRQKHCKIILMRILVALGDVIMTEKRVKKGFYDSDSFYFLVSQAEL